jgi:hypothetical protein
MGENATHPVEAHSPMLLQQKDDYIGKEAARNIRKKCSLREL